MRRSPQLPKQGKFAPALPIVVECYSESLATVVWKAQHVIEQAELLTNLDACYYVLRENEDLANLLLSQPHTLLVDRLKFWAVVWGNNTGIYFEE